VKSRSAPGAPFNRTGRILVQPPLAGLAGVTVAPIAGETSSEVFAALHVHLAAMEAQMVQLEAANLRLPDGEDGDDEISTAWRFALRSNISTVELDLAYR